MVFVITPLCVTKNFEEFTLFNTFQLLIYSLKFRSAEVNVENLFFQIAQP